MALGGWLHLSAVPQVPQKVGQTFPLHLSFVVRRGFSGEVKGEDDAEVFLSKPEALELVSSQEDPVGRKKRG